MASDTRVIEAQLRLRTDSSQAIKELDKVQQRIQNFDAEVEFDTAPTQRGLATRFTDSFAGSTETSDRAALAGLIFGDIDKSIKTLTGTAQELGIISEQTERTIFKLSKTFGSLEAGIRLTGDSIALLRKLSDFTGISVKTLALGLGALTVALSAAILIASENTETANEFVNSLEKVNVAQVQLSEVNKNTLQELRSENESYITTLTRQRDSIRSRIRDADLYSQTLGKALGDQSIKIYADELTRVNKQLADAIRNQSLLNSEFVSSKIRQDDFIAALDDEYNTKKRIADLSRSVNNEQVEAELQRLDIQRQLEEQRIEDLQVQISAENEALSSALRETLTSAFDETLLRDFFKSLTDEEKVLLQSSQNAEEYFENLKRLIDARNELSTEDEELLNAFRDYFVGIAEDLGLVQSAFENFESGTSTLDDELSEAEARLLDLDREVELWTGVLKDAADNNDKLTRNTELVTSKIKTLSDSLLQLQKVDADIAALQAAETERQVADAREKGRESALGLIDSEIKRLELLVEQDKQIAEINRAESDAQQKNREIVKKSTEALLQATQERDNALLDNEKEYRERLEEIQRNAQGELISLAEENDVVGFINRQKQQEKELQEAAQARDKQTQVIREGFNENVRALQEARELELAQNKSALEARLQQLNEASNRELSENERLLQNAQNRKTALQETFARQDAFFEQQANVARYNASLTELQNFKTRLNALISANSVFNTGQTTLGSFAGAGRGVGNVTINASGAFGDFVTPSQMNSQMNRFSNNVAQTLRKIFA